MAVSQTGTTIKAVEVIEGEYRIGVFLWGQQGLFGWADTETQCRDVLQKIVGSSCILHNGGSLR